jgi:hypothetical protein
VVIPASGSGQRDGMWFLIFLLQNYRPLPCHYGWRGFRAGGAQAFIHEVPLEQVPMRLPIIFKDK